MQYSVIENTGVRVSRLSFGTASLHHLYSPKSRQSVLEAAASSGMSHFDTSPYYGFGLAESDLGTFMKGRRDTFTITTKVGMYPYGGPANGALEVWARKAVGKLNPRISAPDIDWRVERASQSLDASLKRLKTDYVDFLFLHEPNIALIAADEFLGWIESERTKGRVRYWGLAGQPSLLSPWMRASHPLSSVLQSKDDLETRLADFILNSSRRLQFTYGYLSSIRDQRLDSGVADVVQKALMRNCSGSILISTRRVKRIEELARIVR